MRKVWLSVAAAVAAAGVLTACGDTGSGEGSAKGDAAVASSSSTAGAGAEDAPAAGSLKDARIVGSGVEDHETWGAGAYVVRYEITNSGAAAADYFVGLEFLDADGDVLGSTGVTADKLGPGKTNRGDTAPLESEISNGPMSAIKSVRVSEVDRT
ncbi:hypothetical protein ACFY7V_03715 [[Kitasatospora] papulosa]|uniref:hypothetical protein n=1 Tax=Streptomyces TaxID=1883 RepID=UPI002FF0EBE9